MAELFSELLGKGQLRQYLLRMGPISLGDICSQSPDRTKTLITLLRLTKEGDARVEGEANAEDCSKAWRRRSRDSARNRRLGALLIGCRSRFKPPASQTL